MQLLFESSAEDPDDRGLGVLSGRVDRLAAGRVPHIGWTVVCGAGPLLAGLPDRFHAYFAHSYAAPAEVDSIAAAVDGPPRFAAAVGSGRVWGVQFHPEKSGAAGSRLLRNFAVLVAGVDAAGADAAGGAAGGVARHGDEPVGPAPPGAAGRARRIIPCLDIKGGRVVKGIRFRDLRDAGDPVERAAAYDADGADEVCLLDISATQEDRRPLIGLVGRVADRLRVPFTVGGGLRDLDEMRGLLLAGADRISIGSAAVADPDLVARAAGRFGSQFVIVSIDALRMGDAAEVTTHGGTRRTGLDAVAWAREVERLGAGEILLNAMEADGTRAGYDVDLTRRVARVVGIPVIASGGAGGAADMARVLIEGEADAALAASIFHDGSVGIKDAKAAIGAAGVPVRP
jgi:cyclase